jgi:hypothetical protein
MFSAKLCGLPDCARESDHAACILSRARTLDVLSIVGSASVFMVACLFTDPAGSGESIGISGASGCAR